MSDLLPPNSTAQERAMSLATARAANVPVKFSELWSPQDCPIEILPWLAWTLSVETWNPAWPDYVKREVVASAVRVARQKGTRKSVSDALLSIGATSVMVEWFEKSPQGPPHTFEINLVSSDSSLEMQAAIASEINRAKPLRAHYTINYGVLLGGRINMCAVLRPAVFARLDGLTQF
jgi:phage tail P2-like protein